MGKSKRLRRKRVVASIQPLRRPRWTKSEVALLKRLYKSHSNAEIAALLGRKVASVTFKGHRLGLSKSMKRLREMGRENISRRWKSRRKPARIDGDAHGPEGLSSRRTPASGFQHP